MVIDFYNRNGGGGTADYATSAGTANVSNSTKLLEGGSALPQSANTGDVVAVAPNLSKRGGAKGGETALGIYQYDGSAWNEIGGETPDFTSLSPLDEFPSSAKTGEVVAISSVKNVYDSVIIPSKTLAFEGNDVLTITTEYGTLTVNTYAKGENIIYFETNDGNSSDIIAVDGESTSLPTNDENHTWEMEYGGDVYIRITENNTPVCVFAIDSLTNNTCFAYLDGNYEQIETLGLYQYDGSVWNAVGGGEGGSNVVHLDSLSGTGVENTLYECDEMLWTWSDSAGTVAEWTDSLATLGNSKGYGLIFSHIPEGQTLLEFKYSPDNNWRKIKMINGVLTLTEADNTVVTSCTIGNKAQFNSYSYNFYWIKVNYKKNWIGFEVSSNLNFQNVWDGTVQGGHFVITDHTNHPWTDISSDYGIPVWDDKGWVIHKQYSVSTKSVKVNRTSYQSTSFVTAGGEGNFPDSFYVPTVGGTAGQILQSNGTEAAPTWTTMIKAQKITSAAYEALVQAGTTDPNTLYLIDDSV